MSPAASIDAITRLVDLAKDYPGLSDRINPLIESILKPDAKPAPPDPVPQPGPNGTVIFNVQHHWVTESGDNIYFDPAAAITTPLSQTRFAFITYLAHITGGTGKFAGATGDLTNIGEADLVLGTAIRYTGQVCFADSDDR